MTSNVSFNPLITTNSAGTFSVQSDGLFQGTAFDDPAIRNALAGGILSTTETLPMWGGVGIYEDVAPSAGFDVSLGGQIGRATSITGGSKNLTGFSVFNQAHAWITTPQSPVPLGAAGMTVPFYRLGSGARIAVAIDPSLVSLEGGLITQAVSWDFNAQVLAPLASAATYAITSITWSGANGGQGVVVAGVATPVGGVGDLITFSGATNTGTGGAAAVNTTFVVTAFTDNQNFTIAMPAAAGVFGTIAGTILAVYDNVALPVKILQIQVGNSYVVNYNRTTGYATWIPTGSSAACAVILI